MEPEQIKSSVQVLIEGKDGRNFLKALCRHVKLGDPQIQNYGGVTELQEFLSALVRVRGFNSVRRLGIIRDAEQSAVSAFQSVQSALRNTRSSLSEQLAVPSLPGTVTEGNPAVGALIVPQHGSGMLETVLWRSLAGTKSEGCIDDFLECMQSDGIELANIDKSRAYAYIATTKRPDVSVGVSVQRGVWQLDHEAFEPITSFLRRLIA